MRLGFLFIALALLAPPTPASARAFAGMYGEGASGLLHMGARHYDPATGRFLQTDPLGIAADHLYAYGANNPYLYWDPSGLKPRGIIEDIDPIDYANTGILADPLLFGGLSPEGIDKMLGTLVNGTVVARGDTLLSSPGFIGQVENGDPGVLGLPTVHYPYGSHNPSYINLTDALNRILQTEGLAQAATYVSRLDLERVEAELALEQARYEGKFGGRSDMFYASFPLNPDLYGAEYWWYAQQIQPGFPGLAVAAPQSPTYEMTFSGHVQSSAAALPVVGTLERRDPTQDQLDATSGALWR